VMDYKFMTSKARRCVMWRDAVQPVRQCSCTTLPSPLPSLPNPLHSLLQPSAVGNPSLQPNRPAPPVLFPAAGPAHCLPEPSLPAPPFLFSLPCSGTSALQEACTDRLLRLGRRRADLRDATARLKQGAAELRAAAEQDNDFYQQVHVVCVRACVRVCVCACVCVCVRACVRA